LPAKINIFFHFEALFDVKFTGFSCHYFSLVTMLTQTVRILFQTEMYFNAICSELKLYPSLLVKSSEHNVKKAFPTDRQTPSERTKNRALNH